jgi:hypothetical protein
MQKLIEYCKELDLISNPDNLESIALQAIHSESEAERQEYLIKITLSTICDQNRKQGMAGNMSEKTAAADPLYLQQINKSLDANLAARIDRSKSDVIQTRIKSLHMLISAEKFLNGGQ